MAALLPVGNLIDIQFLNIIKIWRPRGAGQAPGGAPVSTPAGAGVHTSGAGVHTCGRADLHTCGRADVHTSRAAGIMAG